MSESECNDQGFTRHRMNITRRPYQTRAVKALKTLLPKHHRVLAVSPTGSGKTVMVALLLKSVKRWKKVLFLAHRHELVDQAFDRLADLGIHAGVMMAGDEALNGSARVNPRARVQVASVQTIAARGVPEDVDLIVIDEAHRTMADSYQDIATACPNAEVLGVTATPCRLDGKGLGDFYQHMFVVALPSELYVTGDLVKPHLYSLTSADAKVLRAGLKKVKSQHGDFAQGKLGDAVGNDALIGRVVDSAIRHAPKVPKVVFACTVKHSKEIAKRFRKRGIKAEHLDGETEPQDRQRIITALADGDIEVICNVDVLSEGWDLPSLGAVIVARPTKSLARFLQWIGRVQRPHPGPHPVVIDHGLNWERLETEPGGDIAWTLETGAEGRSAGGDAEPVLRVCDHCEACVPANSTECPHCGAELIAVRSKRAEREEVEAELRRIEEHEFQARREEARARIEKVVAGRTDIPAGWVDRAVTAAMELAS